MQISARSLAPRQARLAALLAALFLLAPSHAQTADPTRPAAAWLAMQPRAPGAVAEAAEQPSTPGVQIVVTGPSRKFAIVDGQPVRPGETYNGARLMDIDPDGVVWQKGGGQERSSLSPGVAKTAPGQREAPQDDPRIRKKILTGEAR